MTDAAEDPMTAVITTKAAFRKTLIIPGTPQKSGQGDKQTDLFLIRDQDDKDGARGSQTSCLSESAVAWTVDQRYRSHLQHAVNLGRITLDAAQAIATREGVGTLRNPPQRA